LPECPDPPSGATRRRTSTSTSSRTTWAARTASSTRDWQVYRWSDRQLAGESERVKDQLAPFLERVPGLLELIRADGKTIALLEHATGSGKTVTAIRDARRGQSRPSAPASGNVFSL
jgi:hypothetical protein